MKPTSLASLASGVLARHRISRQVTAAMVVQSVNIFLDNHLTEPLKNDARALSFVDHVMRIACKNPTASYAMQEHVESISNHLKHNFPDIHIEEIVCILNQDPWMDYNNGMI